MDRLDNSYVVNHKTIKVGHGIELKSFPTIVKNVKAVPAVWYHLRCLHAIMFGHIGSETTRIKNILSFNGFSDSTDQVAKKKSVINNRKKWNKGFLKWFLDLLDLRVVGSRSDQIDRLFEFLACPQKD